MRNKRPVDDRFLTRSLSIFIKKRAEGSQNEQKTMLNPAMLILLIDLLSPSWMRKNVKMGASEAQVGMGGRDGGIF